MWSHPEAAFGSLGRTVIETAARWKELCPLGWGRGQGDKGSQRLSRRWHDTKGRGREVTSRRRGKHKHRQGKGGAASLRKAPSQHSRGEWLRFYQMQGRWGLIEEGLNSNLFFMQEGGGFVSRKMEVRVFFR